MYRTIIIDDDFLVRSYLKQLNSWQRAGYEIVADVRDGEEAVEIIETEKPDVIVTDISMPLMDGIELIKHIRHTNQEIYIIVLSCHDDFEYVKEAMKLGANEYVLKNSLDENTLYNLLVNSANQIENQKLKSDEQERTKKLIKMGVHSLKYNFFNRLLAGNMSMSERDIKRREAGIKGKFINSAVINMFIPNWSEIKQQLSMLEAEQYSQLFLSSLIEQLEILLANESDYVEVIYLGEGIFCCFLDLSSMCKSSMMRQKLTTVASACFRCCEKEAYDYAIGVSNICIGEDGIRQAYQQAREMVKLSFYEDSDILYFDSQKKISKQMPDIAYNMLNNIDTYMTGRKFKDIEQNFEQIIKLCRKNFVDSKVVIHWVKELNEKAKIERNSEYYSKIIKIDQLKDVCNDYKLHMSCDKVKDMPQGVSNMVKQAIDYIHSHYKMQIGLGEVADAVGLNSAYLSYLFKQEMGIGFSNYLLECRMECAKGLLKNTNLKIKDVASESGFNDYHYFSKAFKKLNGYSPADYRKL